MVCVFALNKVSADKTDEFISIAKKLVDETVKEDGCISYEFCEKDDYYVFFERWKSADALDKHTKTSHFLQYVPMMEAIRIDGETTIVEKLF